MINIQPYIAFIGSNFERPKLIKGKFNHPYNQILDRCFCNDTESSIGNVSKVETTLSKIEEVVQGNENIHLIVGFDQDPVIECYKYKCKIVDNGPDEIHSVLPGEVYGPNWNKRNPDKEWIKTSKLVELLKIWKLILKKYEDSVCVPRSAVKDEYWGNDRL